MKIFIWTRTLDHLQLHTWSAVQSILDQQITYVLTEPENLGRKKQGWQAVDLSNLDVIIMKGKGWLRQSLNILEQNSEAIHVFWGFWSERRLFPLIIYSTYRGVKTAVLNEHYSTSPVGYMEDEKFFIASIKVVLRPFLYSIAAFLLKAVSWRKKQICVFTLSLQAREQYLKAGFDKSTLFPFGYFVPAMTVLIDKHENTIPLRLIFVAALLKRKGLDIAIRALQEINQCGIKVTLDVYGSGNPKAFLPKNSDSIIYKGVIPVEQVQSVIAQYNALILPSRHDGWGVVVNESLLQGIPVIVSNTVGAKCLIESSGAGLVFESENVEALVNCLTGILETPTLLDSMRINAGRIKNHILPEVAAQYFLDTLLYYFYDAGSPPRAIWCGRQ